MIKHIWSVLSERISVDQKTGLVSYLSCMEGLNTPLIPANVYSLSLGSRWFNSGSEKLSLNIKIIVIKPDGKETISSEVLSQEILPKSNHRTFFVLDGISFDSYGIYHFQVHQQIGKKFQLVAEIPLDINKLDDHK
jgi:hypothetical protein